MKKCIICGTENTSYTNYCSKHYMQIHRHGEITNSNKTQRRKSEKNVIKKVKESVCSMELYDVDGGLVAQTFFNERHVDVVRRYKWHFDGHYCRTSYPKKIRLHDVIVKKEEGKYVDHKDQDKLNNLDNNLRTVSPQANAFNKTVKGIHFCNEREKWVAAVGWRYRRFFIGRYTTEKEAMIARKAVENFIKKALLNIF